MYECSTEDAWEVHRPNSGCELPWPVLCPHRCWQSGFWQVLHVVSNVYVWLTIGTIDVTYEHGVMAQMRNRRKLCSTGELKQPHIIMLDRELYCTQSLRLISASGQKLSDRGILSSNFWILRVQWCTSVYIIIRWRTEEKGPYRSCPLNSRP